MVDPNMHDATYNANKDNGAIIPKEIVINYVIPSFSVY